MGTQELIDYAKEIAEYERKLGEIRARKQVLECEVAARGYEVEAMYESLLAQEKIHIGTINLLQQIIDHIPMPIFWKNMNGQVVGCNHACETVLNLSKSEIINKTVFDLFDPDFANQYNDADMQTYRDGVYTYKCTFKKINGDIVPAIFHMRVYFDCNNERAGIIIFAHTPCNGRLCP